MNDNPSDRTILCSECGATRPSEGVACPNCGSPHKRVLLALGGEVKVTRGMVGFVHDSPPSIDKPHSIEVRTPLGAQSKANLDHQGTVTLSASGVPDVGTRGESHVCDILAERLRSDGGSVVPIAGARDGRGEDGLLIVQGRQLTLQVTSVPSSSTYWREAAQGSANTQVDSSRAADWLREALLLKATVDARANTILAIDARHAGVLADPAVAGTYRARFPGPESEFGFAQVWVVGPTPGHCTRL